MLSLSTPFPNHVTVRQLTTVSHKYTSNNPQFIRVNLKNSFAFRLLYKPSSGGVRSYKMAIQVIFKTGISKLSRNVTI